MKLLIHGNSWAQVRVAQNEAEILADVIDVFFQTSDLSEYDTSEIENLKHLRLEFAGISRNDYAPFLKVKHRI